MLTFLEKAFPGRIILLDQRGHGFSSWASSYKRRDYGQDLDALIHKEQIQNPHFYGHSLGGINALFQVLRQPSSSLVMEDIGTCITGSNAFIMDLPQCYSSFREAQAQWNQQGISLDPFFAESLSYEKNHWEFRFHREGMVLSQEELNGEYWAEWKQIHVPTLLLRGENSNVTTAQNHLEMCEGQPHVQYQEFPEAGHTIHSTHENEVLNVLKSFWKELF